VEQHTVVQSLAALAQPLRLEIFRALVVAGPRGLTPGAMSEGTGVPPTSLSFHLKELAHAGLVSQQRDGRFLIYRAEFERMNGLLAYLTQNCCQGANCTPGTACSPTASRSKP
jgi:ArsR family transcriptional regulator, arsenate/arsenite/antimonite-responsive transcriptional repressor